MKLRIFSAACALLGLLNVTGCKDFYNVNVDPLHPTSATPAQLLPGTQVAMSTYLGFSLAGLGQATSALVSQLNSSRSVGSFQQNGGSFSNQWAGLYNDMLANNELIIEQTSGIENQKGYLGVAQLQKAYVFSIMVDMWGAIPYSQALKGVNNRAPRFDNDKDIYLGKTDADPSQSIQSLFSLIDEGIANVSASGGGSVSNDLIYGGQMVKWAKFGRTLKLKLYNQIRLKPGRDISADVTALLAQPAQLLETSQDFEVPYGSSFQPENRNISYLSNYVDPSREDVISQDFFRVMVRRSDPRLPFYFYTQARAATGSVDFDTAVTVASITYNFATVRLGSTGVVASTAAANLYTLPGLYPGGGRFDAGSGTTRNAGADFTYARGLVAQRLLTTASRYFTEAELQLTVLNNATDARAAYNRGIQEAFLKVDAVGKAEGTSTTAIGAIPNVNIPSVAPSAPRVAQYITNAMTRYDFVFFNNLPTTTPTTDDQKLSAIMYEKYVAGFGFGEDIYTDYRRTGKPAIRAPGEVPGTVATGSRPERLFYDLGELTSNRNAPRQQPEASSTIFWK